MYTKARDLAKVFCSYLAYKGKPYLNFGKKLKDHCTEEEWKDLINFEGNANAIRILSRQYQGKSKGGLRLTYTTLASLLKYPCASNELINSAFACGNQQATTHS